KNIYLCILSYDSAITARIPSKYGPLAAQSLEDPDPYSLPTRAIKVKGDASSDSAGLIAAIADLVAKLEPKSGSPIISLQNDNRQCIILRKEPVVGAIYKDIST
ncbi:hypothetical protein ALC62_03290, partial [Cyphomyrmex costatus]